VGGAGDGEERTEGERDGDGTEHYRSSPSNAHVVTLGPAPDPGNDQALP
jgi:hypothetical protein